MGMHKGASSTTLCMCVRPAWFPLVGGRRGVPTGGHTDRTKFPYGRSTNRHLWAVARVGHRPLHLLLCLLARDQLPRLSAK
jgi:hypothetical protein